MIFDIVKKKSDESGITDAKSNYEFVGYKKPEVVKEIQCFEDVVISLRLGNWVQGRANLVKIRKDTCALIKEPIEAETNPEPLQLVHGFDTLDTHKDRMDYCGKNGSSLTTARIKIFMRTDTKMLRRFINMNEVKALAQTYTSVPVEIVTANTTTSVENQIRLFNSFDLLITSHGSHLANGLFTIRPETKGVIEIVSFVFDHVFYGNFNAFLGFSDYIISSGHPTFGKPSTGPNPYFGDECPFPTLQDFAKRNCTDEVLTYVGKKGMKIYSNKVSQTWKICPDTLQTRSCDTNVNIPLLKSHMDKIFNEALCRTGPRNSTL